MTRVASTHQAAGLSGEHRSTQSTAWTSASIDESINACRRLANSHYENFHVLSSLVPRQYRDDLAVVYSFCRSADDAADERETIAEARDELDALRAVLRTVGDAADAGDGPDEGRHHAGVKIAETARHCPFAPYAPAWADLILRRHLPLDPFHHLLDAFVQDQRQTRYVDWDDLFGYCRGSANPVGRLVLLVTDHGERDDLDELFVLSDATCTALQLTNFWQDVSRDLIDRDRIYIPASILDRFEISEDDLRAMVDSRRADDRFRQMERRLVEFTRPLFDKGRGLWPMVRNDVRPMIQLFTAGGESILKRIERRGYDVLHSRPRLGSFGKASLFCRAWIGARLDIDLF